MSEPECSQLDETVGGCRQSDSKKWWWQQCWTGEDSPYSLEHGPLRVAVTLTGPTYSKTETHCKKSVTLLLWMDSNLQSTHTNTQCFTVDIVTDNLVDTTTLSQTSAFFVTTSISLWVRNIISVPYPRNKGETMSGETMLLGLCILRMFNYLHHPDSLLLSKAPSLWGFEGSQSGSQNVSGCKSQLIAACLHVRKSHHKT